MSNRSIERAQGTDGSPSDVNVEQWGGVNVAPALPDGSIPVTSTQKKSTLSSKTNVPAVMVSTLLLAPNAARLGATIYNDSATANLYLSLSVVVSSVTSFTVKLVPQAYYEVPFNWAGAITGIWDAAVGDARVTEFT